MSKKRAFVRYTKSGEIVPGSLIITTNGGYPDKSSIWKEIQTNECCDGGESCNPDDVQSKIFLELRYGATNCNWTTGYTLYIAICCNGVLTLFTPSGEIAPDGFYQTRISGDFIYSYQVINGQLIKVEDCP